MKEHKNTPQEHVGLIYITPATFLLAQLPSSISPLLLQDPTGAGTAASLPQCLWDQDCSKGSHDV